MRYIPDAFNATYTSDAFLNTEARSLILKIGL